MERGIALIDFMNIDSMVQIHGNSHSPVFMCRPTHVVSTDHEGVGLRSHTANTKAAATQATKIFQDYYPEFLVRVLNYPYSYQPSPRCSPRSSTLTFQGT